MAKKKNKKKPIKWPIKKKPIKRKPVKKKQDPGAKFINKTSEKMVKSSNKKINMGKDIAGKMTGGGNMGKMSGKMGGNSNMMPPQAKMGLMAKEKLTKK